MKSFKLLVGMVLISLSLSVQAFNGRVTAVHDGDSLTVLNESNLPEKIRIYRIDAPEMNYSNVPKQPYADEARIGLSEICLGKLATITRKGLSYGRSVAIVHCAGIDASNWQLYHGNAWVYRYTSTKALRFVQDSAKTRNAGLWALPNPVEPYSWRRGAR
jgi:micrococcal nuclease